MSRSATSPAYQGAIQGTSAGQLKETASQAITVRFNALLAEANDLIGRQEHFASRLGGATPAVETPNEPMPMPLSHIAILNSQLDALQQSIVHLRELTNKFDQIA